MGCCRPNGVVTTTLQSQAFFWVSGVLKTFIVISFKKCSHHHSFFSPTQVGGIPLSTLKSSRPGVDVEVNAPRHLEHLDKLHLEDQQHHNHKNQGWRFSFSGSKLRPAEMFRPDPLPLQQQYLLATRPRLVFDAMIGDLNWSENYKSGLRVQRNGTLHGSQLGEPGHFMTSLNLTPSPLYTLAIKTQP